MQSNWIGIDSEKKTYYKRVTPVMCLHGLKVRKELPNTFTDRIISPSISSFTLRQSGISLKGFRLDVLDIGFIILLGMMTYQGQTIQALCSTGFCGV